MQLDSGQWIVFGLCAVLIAVYAGGYYANRRLGEQVVAWLHTGLRRWGRVTAGSRLGGMATGGRLYVKNAGAPFQNIEAVFLLLPRENLIFWLFDRLRGRQDELILKISLRFAPKKNAWAEVSPRRDRDFQQAIDNENLTPVEPIIGGLNIARGDKDAPLNDPVTQFLEKHGKQVIQFSIRKQAPHIILRAHLKPLLQSPANDLLSLLGELNNSEKTLLENQE